MARLKNSDCQKLHSGPVRPLERIPIRHQAPEQTGHLLTAIADEEARRDGRGLGNSDTWMNKGLISRNGNGGSAFG